MSFKIEKSQFFWQLLVLKSNMHLCYYLETKWIWVQNIKINILLITVIHHLKETSWNPTIYTYTSHTLHIIHIIPYTSIGSMHEMIPNAYAHIANRCSWDVSYINYFYTNWTRTRCNLFYIFNYNQKIALRTATTMNRRFSASVLTVETYFPLARKPIFLLCLHVVKMWQKRYSTLVTVRQLNRKKVYRSTTLQRLYKLSHENVLISF